MHFFRVLQLRKSSNTDYYGSELQCTAQKKNLEAQEIF